MDRRPDGEVLTAAAGNRLLDLLPERERNVVLTGASLLQLEHLRELYREGGRVSAVYFPINAVMSLLIGDGETAAVEIATVGNEGVVGTAAVLGISRSFGRMIVQVAGQAIAISAKKANELLCSEPAFSALLQRYLYAFICEIAQASACNRLHNAEERCARWLLMTHDRARTDRFGLTQEFMATMMGTRRATVNLVLSMFRNAGAIDYSYRVIQVLNRELLESFSCPCYQIIQKAFEIIRL